MPAPLCSTHLLSSSGRAETRPLLSSGTLRSGFLSGLDLRSTHRLLWRSCVISGAVGSGLVVAQHWEKQHLGTGQASLAQSRGAVLIRVSGAEHRLSVCAVQAGPELVPVKLIHQLGADPLPTAAGAWWCLGILQPTLLAPPSASLSQYLLVHSLNSTRWECSPCFASCKCTAFSMV